MTKTVLFFQKAKRIRDGESLVLVGNIRRSLLSCQLNEKRFPVSQAGSSPLKEGRIISARSMRKRAIVTGGITSI